MRQTKLPFLPGMVFRENIGQTKFGRPSHLRLLYGVSALTDGPKVGIGGAVLGPPAPPPYRAPCVYPRGEGPELPSWLAYNNHVLSFNAHFQQTLHEKPPGGLQVRRCVIQYFLEDGTIKVKEPPVPNSGLTQGVFISRQRIPYPRPRHDEFYTILDFNVGLEVELYGRVFKITDCDRFTRTFLNRLGISVSDPLPVPEDPLDLYMERKKDYGKTPNRKIDYLKKFLEFDKQVLRFWGYWDDRCNEFGALRHLEIRFYLGDDTLEIKEDIPENSGNDTSAILLKRCRCPKTFTYLPPPGCSQADPFTVLNVMGGNSIGPRIMADVLQAGYQPTEYYEDSDLAIGSILEVYGRKVCLTDCDPFTKEYYRVKFGLDNFQPAPKPPEPARCAKTQQRQLPPWNGYGSYEDSAQNCLNVVLKPPRSDFVKFIKLDKRGHDSMVLRYGAKMISKNLNDEGRYFVVSYFLANDTMAVFELAKRNSGFLGGKFYKRNAALLPDQAPFLSDPPERYGKKDIFIGAKLQISGFLFDLESADEYALRYMELHPSEFPVSDVNRILGKIREKLLAKEGGYKEFVAKHLPCIHAFKVDKVCVHVIAQDTIRRAMKEILGEEFVEHELVTISRYYSAERRVGLRFAREEVRALLHTELRRYLWDDLERLLEHMRHLDHDNTGHLPRKLVYYALKACRIPADGVLLNRVLDVLKKNEQCEINFTDLIDFFNVKLCPLPGVIPVNVKYDLHWASEREPDIGHGLEWERFLKDLDLEEELLQQTH